MKEAEEQIIVINDKIPMNSNLLARESIYIYRNDTLLKQEGLSSNGASQKLLQQFNVDFDREIVTIMGKTCQSRCTFFRKVTEIVHKQSEMDLLLLLCQQTILANALQNVQEMLQRHQLPYLIRDSRSSTKINLEPVKKSKKSTDFCDFEVKVKKQMYLVDHLDPELIVNVFDITIDLFSLKKSQEVQISVKFQWPLEP